MKVSVIISACENREHLFDRALYTWNLQTLPKKEWELIIVDDGAKDSVKEQCRNASKIYNINTRYIRIDKSKSFHKVKTFTPALTNNVGFRQAKGEVICVTGPETLQENTNLEVAATMINRKECAYGLVYKASTQATDILQNEWESLKNKKIIELLKIPGAKEGCVTKPPNPPRYWYFMAVAKKYIEKIGGVDERFVGGLCAEDDDFSTRIKTSGVNTVFNHNMISIHQNHSREDNDDNIHINRITIAGRKLRMCNLKLWKNNIKNSTIIVNKDHRWGDENLIILDETYLGEQ